MRILLVSIIAFVLFFSSCEKRVKDYKDIYLFSSQDSSISITTLNGELRVFTFISPECPLSENYTRTLLSLQDDFGDMNVMFYYVFPGTFYHKEQIIQFLKTYNIPIEKAYFDPEYHFKDYCSASITPEAVILNWAGKIEYSGAIDNWAITLGKQRQVISEHYVSDALTSLLDGEKVKVTKTRAVGCIIE